LLPSELRLSVGDLKETVKQGRHRRGTSLTVALRTVLSPAAPQFAIICGKRVGNAPTRNLVRRRLREICRLDLAAQLPAGTQLVVRALPNSSSVSYHDLAAELVQLANRASLGTGSTTGRN